MAGSFAYFAAAWRIEADLFTNVMSLQNAAIHCTHVRKFYTLAGFAVLFQGLFAFLIVYLQNDHLLWISFFFFIVHLILSEYFLLRNIKPHFVASMEEFDANRLLDMR
jgi:hypothetical protein